MELWSIGVQDVKEKHMTKNAKITKTKKRLTFLNIEELAFSSITN